MVGSEAVGDCDGEVEGSEVVGEVVGSEVVGDIDGVFFWVFRRGRLIFRNCSR